MITALILVFLSAHLIQITMLRITSASSTVLQAITLIQLLVSEFALLTAQLDFSATLFQDVVNPHALLDIGGKISRTSASQSARLALQIM